MAICSLYIIFSGFMLSCLKRGLVWDNFDEDVMTLMAFFDIFEDIQMGHGCKPDHNSII